MTKKVLICEEQQPALHKKRQLVENLLVWSIRFGPSASATKWSIKGILTWTAWNPRAQEPKRDWRQSKGMIHVVWWKNDVLAAAVF